MIDDEINELKIGLCGSTGKTGKAILAKIKSLPNFEIAGEFSSCNKPEELAIMCQNSDVVVDFSNQTILHEILENCIYYKKPLVSGITGLDESQMSRLKQASLNIPVVYSSNMSLGATLLTYLVNNCAKILSDDYDSEIIEYHHRYKKDAPSGTAMMLAKEIAKVKNLSYKESVVFSRTQDNIRNSSEIGISSIRGGGIMGEHEVIFVSDNEVIKVSHQVLDRSTYADGALKAATWIYKKQPGLYTMKDVLNI